MKNREFKKIRNEMNQLEVEVEVEVEIGVGINILSIPV